MNFKNLVATLCLGSFAFAPLAAQNEPYKNADLSPGERAWDLLKRMTLEEKLGQMRNGASEVKHLGIERYNWWNEALHGVGRAGLATVFPQAIGMAATFDDQAVYETFDMVSDEARAKHHYFKKKGDRGGYKGLTFWTPNVNIFRDPRWGRGQETYGEDPYLTTRMGVAVVKGLQGDGTGKYDKTHACAKHYAVHSGPEWNRHSFDAKNISPRDLYETYLPSFKALVQEAKVKEVMCAYNRFEGEPCCSNKQLLVKILREDWGFDDVVVSDCGAIGDLYKPKNHGTHPDAASASADAVMSGTDLECGGSYHSLKEAIKKGLISEDKIDESVFRLLRARFQLGLFDDDEKVSWSSIPYSVVNSKKHQEQALEMARKSIVLLTNRNQTLPLKKKMKKIAVLGPNAADSIMMWGNYNGSPAHTVTVLEGIRRKLPRTEVFYDKGCDYVDNMVMHSFFDQCTFGGKKGFKAEFWNNKEATGNPVVSTQLSEPFNFITMGGTAFIAGVNLNNFSGRFESVFTPAKTGEVTFYLAGDDGTRLYVDGKRVIDDWGNGPAKEKTYTMRVEAGKKYPIVLEYWQGGGKGELHFDLGYKSVIDFQSVVAKVEDADAIVFVGGLSPKLEGEEMGVKLPGFKNGDRTNIDLPKVQKDMLQALKKTGKPVIFVVCTGSTIALPEEAATADAMLNAWYPGQAGGTAVADVLFGDYNPAGRLPLTFYASSTDLPDFMDYSMTNRTYRYFKGKPLFPFGYGLSFTSFEYGKAKLSSQKVKIGGEMTLTIPVSNVGKRDGDEVVQVYIRNLNDKEGPAKSLRAFRRVNIKAGKTIPVEIKLPSSAFEFFDSKIKNVNVLPGKYELLYGGSSDDGHLTSVTVQVVK